MYFEAKMHQISISAGTPPDPAGGAHSDPPEPLAGFKESYLLLLREGKRVEEKRGGEGDKEGGEKGRGLEPPPLQISGYATGSISLEYIHT